MLRLVSIGVVMDVRIDEEFKALIPPLSPEERAQLEESILEEGVRDPIIVWQGVIVDGHNRHDIATKHGISFDVVSREFEDRTDAMVWMVDNQRGRRNLTKAAWLELGFKRAELLRPRAEANQGKRTDLFHESEKGLEPVNTVKEAADYAGVSVYTASKYKKVMVEGDDDLKESVRTGDTKINRAYEELKRPAKVSLYTHDEEWYTPSEHIENARAVLGEIDTDPASSDDAQEVVQASTYYTKQDNGLEKPWYGNVWLNPPYQMPEIANFTSKLVSEYNAGNVKQAIMLCPNSTDTKWFIEALNACKLVCFTKGRVRFYKKSAYNEKSSPPNGHAFFYFGENPAAFATVFKRVGSVLELVEGVE
jgi:phage N-6-adenine-methyltransferase